MTPLQSQILGISLAVATAIGSIAYERIVKTCSMGSIAFLSLVFYLGLMIFLYFLNKQIIYEDIAKCLTDPSLKWWTAIYFLSWITVPMWFWITKSQSVMAGAIYEVKYIVILGIFYVLMGQVTMSWNIVFSIICALGSIFFISRS